MGLYKIVKLPHRQVDLFFTRTYILKQGIRLYYNIQAVVIYNTIKDPQWYAVEVSDCYDIAKTFLADFSHLFTLIMLLFYSYSHMLPDYLLRPPLLKPVCFLLH